MNSRKAHAFVYALNALVNEKTTRKLKINVNSKYIWMSWLSPFSSAWWILCLDESGIHWNLGNDYNALRCIQSYKCINSHSKDELIKCMFWVFCDISLFTYYYNTFLFPHRCISVCPVFTGNTETECIPSEEAIVKCVFTKNIVSTKTNFRVVFYPDNNESGMLSIIFPLFFFAS